MTSLPASQPPTRPGPPRSDATRILAIDHGDRRFGLAISDPDGSIAFALEVVEGEAALLEMLPGLLDDRAVERVVLGLPLNMDGTMGPRVALVLEFRKRLEDLLAVEVEVWDERLTTVEAERSLREAGCSPRQRRRVVDKVAAQILLQSYLDTRRRAPDDEQK